MRAESFFKQAKEVKDPLGDLLIHSGEGQGGIGLSCLDTHTLQIDEDGSLHYAPTAVRGLHYARPITPFRTEVFALFDAARQFQKLVRELGGMWSLKRERVVSTFFNDE